MEIMKNRSLRYTLLLMGIILVVPLAACMGKPEPALPPAPPVQWSRTFGEGNNVSGGPVQQTKDSGYILCGMIETPNVETHRNEYGTLLIKTDAYGNKLWDKTFDGGYINSLQQTTDDGYIMCGNFQFSEYEDSAIWLIKTDAAGNKIWDQTFKDKKSGLGNSVQQTTDGGYILCGTMELYGDDNDDIWLIKTDAEGNKLWDKTFGSEHDNTGRSVQQTADGGYILCGIISYRASEESYSSWPRLIKTDADGNTTWDKTLGAGDQQCGDVRQTNDGGYIVCGNNMIVPWAIQVLLIRTDASGNKLWDKSFGGRGVAFSFAVQQTTDGGYVTCGVKYRPMGSGNSLWVIKTDADGNGLWEGRFDDAMWNSGNSIQQTADGGYIVCGRTSNHIEEGHSILLLKLAPEP
jgi:uncharacterized protein YunC (DUF1805 family)